VFSSRLDWSLRAQGTHAQLLSLYRELLRLRRSHAALARLSWADSEVAEIDEPTLCCGSAGVYNLLNPDPANQLGDRKVENLLATKADAVISANPGCLLQLMSSLRRRGLADMPAFHMVELLDASIRNVPLAGVK